MPACDRSIFFPSGPLAGRYLRHMDDHGSGAVITPTADPNLALRTTPARANALINRLNDFGHPAEQGLLGDALITGDL